MGCKMLWVVVVLVILSGWLFDQPLNALSCEFLRILTLDHCLNPDSKAGRYSVIGVRIFSVILTIGLAERALKALRTRRKAS